MLSHMVALRDCKVGIQLATVKYSCFYDVLSGKIIQVTLHIVQAIRCERACASVLATKII